MFEELGKEIREEVVFTLFHAEIAPAEAAELEQAQQRAEREPVVRARDGCGRGRDRGRGRELDRRRGARSAWAARRRRRDAAARSSRRAQEKVGRNDPCWCGSGKKFKKCHGA